MGKVFTLDTHYSGLEKFDAVYLVQSGSEWALVDSGTSTTAPAILTQLAKLQVPLERVRYLLLTHIHLDHAGGAGTLLSALPQATVCVHPRGLRHLIDPEALTQSALQVYGHERFLNLYGNLIPVPSSRIRVLNDGETFDFGTTFLAVREARGHAKHHLLFQFEKNWFVGDALGLHYPQIHPLSIASTSPTQFEPMHAIEVIQWALRQQDCNFYPTHFGKIEAPQIRLALVKEHLEQSIQWMRSESRHDAEAAGDFERAELQIVENATAWLRRKAALLGIPESRSEILDMDLKLNAQGLLWSAHSKSPPALA